MIGNDIQGIMKLSMGEFVMGGMEIVCFIFVSVAMTGIFEDCNWEDFL